MNERACGALLGLAVGDALGTTYEFQVIEQPAYPALATGPATDVVGAGPFGLAAGAITDDTQLAVCLARSLVEHGEVVPADLAPRYVAWRRGAFDCGNQTSSALAAFERTGDATLGGLAAWRESGRRAAGNGSLMRTAPIGVALRAELPEAIIDGAFADSMITHADPRCALACAVYNVAIAQAINAPHAGTAIERGRSMVSVATAALATAAQRLTAAWERSGDAADLATIEPARAELALDLVAALADDPQVYEDGMHVHHTAGYVRLAFRLAFWHAAHAPDWRTSLVDVASRGGDADTNAAIVGALLGARDGISALPPAWVERVLAARQKGSDAWGEAHHPKHLLALG